MAQKTSKSLSPRGRFWHKHVQQWQRSGATQVQYCKEHQLSVPAFRWWRRKLGNDLPTPGSRERPPSASVPTFTEIRIPQGHEAVSAYAYEILLPNGVHVQLCRNFDVQAVSALVSVLGVPC
ncbi:MAG TPA: hypothetical protein PLU25_13190 [Acidobacteriota bacterium]|nr:hypothetical protein [Acidobacteriota bacterium]